LRIVINVPESFKDDEIIINLNREEPLPFSDGVTPEDIPDLTEKEMARMNATADYYKRSMSSEVEVLEEDDDDYANGDFGGDIEIG